MLIQTPGTLSTRTFRQVDVLRLISDSVFGLWSDAPRAARMKEQTSDGLQEWAKGTSCRTQKRRASSRDAVRSGTYLE
ncbi:hypothetical protein DL767_003584 [Monosporascus sp. MG133]|nr:hypothetical protein DL767_003584 [Monosporascus sp. MG133]